MYNRLKLNQLNLNVKKTKWKLIVTQKLEREQDIPLSINGESLEKVEEYKYLNWHFHIDKMCSKISEITGLRWRMEYFMYNQNIKMLYNVMVPPLYGNIIYSTTDQTYLKRLQTLHNKGARYILNCNFKTHIKGIL